MANATTSAEFRAKLVDALKIDLIGAWPGHPFANELLLESPTRWYLIIAPTQTELIDLPQGDLFA